MDTIFKTLRVKATTVSMHLRIYLCALKIPIVPSASTLLTCDAGIMNVHDFFLLTSSVIEPLYQQVHLGRQHVYLLELVHSTSLAGLSLFFILTLVGSHLLHKSYCISYSK
jgi:hypothetical protein